MYSLFGKCFHDVDVTSQRKKWRHSLEEKKITSYKKKWSRVNKCKIDFKDVIVAGQKEKNLNFRFVGNVTGTELWQFFLCLWRGQGKKIIEERAGVSEGNGFYHFQKFEDAERVLSFLSLPTLWGYDPSLFHIDSYRPVTDIHFSTTCLPGFDSDLGFLFYMDPFMRMKSELRST